MIIDDFIWLPDILDKIASKHQVTEDEGEEVFFNRPRYRFVESGSRRGYERKCRYPADQHLQGKHAVRNR